MAERVKGVWAKTGEEVSFFNEVCGHTLTDDEVEKLLAGETIQLTGLKSKAGNTFDAPCKLEENTWTDKEGNEHEGVRANLQFEQRDPNQVPDSWAGYTFSEDEKLMLRAGKVVHIEGVVSKKTGNTYDCDVVWGISEGKKRIVPGFADDFQDACNHAGADA